MEECLKSAEVGNQRKALEIPWREGGMRPMRKLLFVMLFALVLMTMAGCTAGLSLITMKYQGATMNIHGKIAS